MLGWKVLLATAVVSVSMAALAQHSATVTNADALASRIAELRAKAAGSGSASVKLEDYPNHYTMLAFRTRTGDAEVHKVYADVFVVLKGQAKLVSGGRLESARAENSEEPRGKAVAGGTEQTVKAGDILHIPAGVPHQLVIAAGEEFVYYVYKIHE